MLLLIWNWNPVVGGFLCPLDWRRKLGLGDPTLRLALLAHPPGREAPDETSSDHRAEDVAISALLAVLFGKPFDHQRSQARA